METSVQENITTTYMPSHAAPRRRLWSVEFSCAITNGRDDTPRGYTMVNYYVPADSAAEAQKIAESWLPKRYQPEDKVKVNPWSYDVKLMVGRRLADAEAKAKRRRH